VSIDLSALQSDPVPPGKNAPPPPTARPPKKENHPTFVSSDIPGQRQAGEKIGDLMQGEIEYLLNETLEQTDRLIGETARIEILTKTRDNTVKRANQGSQRLSEQ